MKRVSFFLGWIFLLIVAVSAQDKIVKLKIVETSDIHGNYYPCLLYTSDAADD